MIINLASETERLAFQASQLERLGIAYQRLEAKTPETLTPAKDSPYWTCWQRPLRTTEMAAFASHRSAWEYVAASDAPNLILEDDAVLMPGVPDLLAQLSSIPEAEFVTLETRGRRKRIAVEPHGGLPLHRLWQDRTGAAAYVLWPSAARKLLARVATAPGLADAILCAAYDLNAWQAVPALACQLDRCEAEGFAPPIETQSAIGKEAKPSAKPSLVQRLRRVSGQARMGLRALAHANAQNVIVPLKRD
ncbi:glycosyltransferase family 25 protein [Gymnodinialimonas hymeniacidonis]|uniref:glycosyltransferase family 25 protein n=1 Tax=Gymnodinialimonas hymeniacidonis TaxID=3126508 RepID=UPI0034C6515B